MAVLDEGAFKSRIGKGTKVSGKINFKSPAKIEEIGRLMEHVSPKSRAVLLMRYREELSLDAIALILDIPLGTAKSRLAYGLSSLRLLANNKEQSHDYPGKR